jgi:hypothetical protein
MATVSISLSSPPSTLDGVTLAIGDRILLNGQSTQLQNGIYQYNGASTLLTRTFDLSLTSRVNKYDSVIVGSGSMNGGKLMYFNSNVVGATISIDTDNISTQAASVITTLNTPAPIASTYSATIVKSATTTPGTRDVVYDIRGIRSNDGAIVLNTASDPNSVSISFGGYTMASSFVAGLPDVSITSIASYDMLIIPSIAKIPVNFEALSTVSNFIPDRDCTYQLYTVATDGTELPITQILRLPVIQGGVRTALVSIFSNPVEETFTHPTLGTMTATSTYNNIMKYRVKILSPSTTLNAKVAFRVRGIQ